MSDTPESQATEKPAADPKADKAPVEKVTKEKTTDKAAAEKPAAAAATATAEKPAPPPEPPFSTDELQSSTARFTHKAWYLYYNNRKDMTFIRETPIRATIEARTPAGAEELHTILRDEGVKEISRKDKVISLTATFETIQKIIRKPQTYKVDAVAL